MLISLCTLFWICGCQVEIGDTEDEDPFTPVLSPGSAGDWDEKNVVDPWVFYGHDTNSDTDGYIMYYSGCNNAETYCIGYAFSETGTDWIKPDLGGGYNICLSNGAHTAWNESGVIGPCVIKTGSDYHMWFTGYDDTKTFQIGYASSTNGTSWIPAGSPVLSPTGNPGDFDQSHVRGIGVWYSGGTFHIYYTGIDSQGYARIGYISTTAPDTLSNAETALTNLGPSSGTYHSGGMRSPCVLYDSSDTAYKMWPTASGYLSSIGYAESSDPDSGWLITSSPVLTNHSTGFDSVQVALSCVIKHPSASGFLMWYSGWSPERICIGYATSSDGFSWTKYK